MVDNGCAAHRDSITYVPRKGRRNDGASHVKGLNNRVNYMLFHRKSVQRYQNILICAIFFVLLYSIF